MTSFCISEQICGRDALCREKEVRRLGQKRKEREQEDEIRLREKMREREQEEGELIE